MIETTNRYFCDACGREYADPLFNLTNDLRLQIKPDGWAHFKIKDNVFGYMTISFALTRPGCGAPTPALCEQCFESLVLAALPHALRKGYHGSEEPGRPAPFWWIPKNRTLLSSEKEEPS